MAYNAREAWRERFCILVQKKISARRKEFPNETDKERQMWFSQWMKEAINDQLMMRKQKEERNSGKTFEYTPKCGISSSDLLIFSIDYNLILHILLREKCISTEMNKMLYEEEMASQKTIQKKLDTSKKKKLPKGQLEIQI